MSVREEFEAYAEGRFAVSPAKWKHPNGEYVYHEEAWISWQAAYAAGRKAGLEEAAEKAYATIMRHPGPTDAEAAATAAAIRALSNAD